MEMLKVATNVWVPKDKILYIEEKKGNPVVARLKYLEDKELLHNRCGRKRQLSVIYLTSGDAIISPISVKTLRKWYVRNETDWRTDDETGDELYE